MKDINILAIESSCDETACSVVRNGKDILSNIVSSQINVHKAFGGVIPEVASRIHVENISYVIEQAITQSQLTMEDIDAVAFTEGPGLVGCLHIGNQAAKTMAFVHQKPLIGVHHLAGHIYANRFVCDLQFPLLALVVSGGHTELVYMEQDYQFKVIGSTQDDAIGEAYDKVARLLGLGYPGGPKIDQLSKEGQPIYPFPRVKVDKPLDFSFSGLKSATLQFIQRSQRTNSEYNNADLAASFQEAVLNQLIDKTKIALEQYTPRMFVLAGGVAANSRLRYKVSQELQTQYPGVQMFVPPLWCCTDNAAMIGAAGYVAYVNGFRSDYATSANPALDIEQIVKK